MATQRATTLWDSRAIASWGGTQHWERCKRSDVARPTLCEHFCFFHFQSEKARGTGAAFAPRCDASVWNDIGITVCDCLTCLYLISDGASFLLHLSRLPRCSHTHRAAHSAFAFTDALASSRSRPHCLPVLDILGVDAENGSRPQEATLIFVDFHDAPDFRRHFISCRPLRASSSGAHANTTAKGIWDGIPAIAPSFQLTRRGRVEPIQQSL